MAILKFALFLLASGTVHATIFNNPILGNQSYYHPGAIKENGTYYVVAETPSDLHGILAINSSTDLINWQPAGYIFNGNNTPTYPVPVLFDCPEIHKIGNNFIVYFIVFDDREYSIGAAIAPHPLGPYIPTIDPVKQPTTTTFDPTVIYDEDKLYLAWYGASYSIYARQLKSDGLSFSSNETITLLKPSLDWEMGYLRSPSYIRRGSYHYLFYTGGYFSLTSVGVARSSNALGPYEKLPDPILVNNNEFDTTGIPSIVSDLEDKNHVIFFSAERKSDGALANALVMLASVGWGADEWPYIQDY